MSNKIIYAILGLISFASCTPYLNTSVSLDEAVGKGEAKTVSSRGKVTFFNSIELVDSNYYGVKGKQRVLLNEVSVPSVYLSVYSNSESVSQDSIATYRIITKDGNEFIGSLEEQDAKKIMLKTSNFGIITIQKADLQSMTIIEEEKIIDGAYWQEHMQSTRHFWSPNGYGLKKGEAYYQNVWLFFNQVSVGVTDNILIGGGLIPLFLLAGTPSPVWVTPKVSFPVVENKVNVGVGGLFATVVGSEGSNLGITYGTATFGPRDMNLTVGVGYGYLDGDWGSTPTFSLSYISRVGKRG